MFSRYAFSGERDMFNFKSLPYEKTNYSFGALPGAR
jgi:hypothetical protein